MEWGRGFVVILSSITAKLLAGSVPASSVLPHCDPATCVSDPSVSSLLSNSMHLLPGKVPQQHDTAERS